DSHWSRQSFQLGGSNATAFIVETGVRDTYAVVVVDRTTTYYSEDRASTKVLVDGMRRHLPQGWEISGEPVVTASAIPFRGSLRVKASFRLSGGRSEEHTSEL